MADQPEPPAATPEPAADPRPTGAAIPRRHITAERQTPGLDAQLADLTNTVRALAQHVAGEAVVEPEAAPDRASRRRKKFTRTGGGDERGVVSSLSEPTSLPAADDPSSPPSTPRETRKTGGADFNKNVAWPREGQAEAAEIRARTPPRRNRRKKKVALAGLMTLAVALLVLGYLIGRGDAPPAGAPGDSTNLPRTNAPASSGFAYRISERNLDAINQALHKARTGDKASLQKFFEESLDQHLAVPGLQYQAALAAWDNKDLVTADAHQDDSVNANEFVAACCYARARYKSLNAQAQTPAGRYHDVVEDFKTAVHAEPFNGKYFFFLAEALRRAGELQKAVDTFELARDRAKTEAEDVLYLFKERLAKVISGQDNAFNTELADRLKEQPVAGDWLMLAAARDIDAGNHKEAAEFLRQAANALPPPTYNLWVKDFAFQTAQGDPLLTALLRRPPIPDSTEQPGAFLDPTVGPPELLDPAIWPVSAGAK